MQEPSTNFYIKIIFWASYYVFSEEKSTLKKFESKYKKERRNAMYMYQLPLKIVIVTYYKHVPIQNKSDLLIKNVHRLGREK